jgi:hypothetical protein
MLLILNYTYLVKEDAAIMAWVEVPAVIIVNATAWAAVKV